MADTQKSKRKVFLKTIKFDNSLNKKKTSYSVTFRKDSKRYTRFHICI